MTVVDRLDACQGLTVEDIDDRFAGLDQDAITRDLVGLLAERTDLGRLPAVPYAVRLTMYGDAEVSDWVLRYTKKGTDISEAGRDETVDLATRWEHWEDLVRLLNGDVAALSLLYARRVVCIDQPAQAEPAWFAAVRFAPTSVADEHGRVLGALADALHRGPKHLAEVVRREGIGPITEARALVVARALVDAGTADELVGSYMRMFVPGDEPVVVQAEFGATSASTSVVRLDAEPPSSPTDAGVTLRYASRDALVAVAAGEMNFQQLLVNGLVKVEGPEARVECFGRALMRFGQLFKG